MYSATFLFYVKMRIKINIELIIQIDRNSPQTQRKS